VELLIANGADVNAKGTRRWYFSGESDFTPLHYAAELGHKDIAELLVASGANIETKTKFGGYTQLHFAAGKGHKDVAELLVANGANINAQNKSGNTPLQLAQNKNYKEIVELLRMHGAKE